MFVSEQPVVSEKEQRKSGQQTNGSTAQQKTEHVVHCQACARKRNHLLDNFVILNQYHLDELKNVYDQFQLYVPSIVGLINTNPNVNNTQTSTTNTNCDNINSTTSNMTATTTVV